MNKVVVIFLLVIISVIAIEVPAPPNPFAPGTVEENAQATSSNVQSSTNPVDLINSPPQETQTQGSYEVPQVQTPVAIDFSSIVPKNEVQSSISNAALEDRLKGIEQELQAIQRELDVQNVKSESVSRLIASVSAQNNVILEQTKSKSGVWLIVAVILALVVVGGIALLLSRKKQSREQKSANSSGLESYVRSALAQGYSKESISEQLVKSGWDQESVNRILR